MVELVPEGTSTDVCTIRIALSPKLTSSSGRKLSGTGNNPLSQSAHEIVPENNCARRVYATTLCCPEYPCEDDGTAGAGAVPPLLPANPEPETAGVVPSPPPGGGGGPPSRMTVSGRQVAVASA